MLMYVLMFLSALRLRNQLSSAREAFKIPGGKMGTWLVCLLGLMGCLITLFVGFIPPSNLNIGSSFYYEILFCSGMAAMILPIGFFYWYQRRCTIKIVLPGQQELANATKLVNSFAKDNAL